jgi:superfamily II DNA/RNA helicase
MEVKRFGRTVTIVHEGEVKTFTSPDADERNHLVELVEKHNNSKSEAAKGKLLKQINKIATAKDAAKKKVVEDKETKLKAEKKLVKKKVKEEEQEEVVANTQALALVESIGESLKEDEQDNRVKELQDENDKLKEKLKALESKQVAQPVTQTSTLARRGEY